MEFSLKTLLMAAGAILAVGVVIFMLRSCKELEIKKKNTDDKTSFSIEVEKTKPE